MKTKFLLIFILPLLFSMQTSKAEKLKTHKETSLPYVISQPNYDYGADIEFEVKEVIKADEEISKRIEFYRDPDIGICEFFMENGKDKKGWEKLCND